MADTKSTDAEKPEAAAAPAAAEQAQTQAQQPVQVQVKDDKAVATYANFCRVTGSPEELIVDFGLIHNRLACRRIRFRSSNGSS